MSDFESNYRALNAAQKEAVDTLEGPVMVVAGPGTGKTQLLATRVANILRQTDATTANILCLTFTESGAAAMRSRLISLVGPDAAKIAIHTFHSFGSEVINAYPASFYNGAKFRPADELSSYEVLKELFQKLGSESPIVSTMNGEYTALRDTQKAISQLKQSGLTAAELRTILNHNQNFINFATPLVKKAFAERLSKQSIKNAENLLKEILKFKDEPLTLVGYEPLNLVFAHSLERALDEVTTQEDSTKPLRAWRDSWFSKNFENEFVFKDEKRAEKLLAVADLYEAYRHSMEERELFDFDDMILRVVHRLEISPDIRFDLQERYLYILVDEFQDTNNAQMRLLWNLTNNPVAEGRPNLMVVGDDDQAIFRFQGADISNILDFKKLYKNPKVIALTDNYRSGEKILNQSRIVITKGNERLENILGISKVLKPQTKLAAKAEHHQFNTLAEEYSWIANLISKKIKNNQEIAVIARRHQQLSLLLPYLAKHKVPIHYERQDNVLESEPMVQLELLSRVVVALQNRNYRQADGWLPELLAHPAWQVSSRELWQIGLESYKNRQSWLEYMLEGNEKVKNIAGWLIDLSREARRQPFEVMCDLMLGSRTLPEFTSPLKNYFFSSKMLSENPAVYLDYLSALSTTRTRLQEYRPDTSLKLSDFCEFISLHKSTGIVIADTKEFHSAQAGVQLLTAHKAKGLEFDTVFILGLTEKRWGEKSRGYSSSISFTSNLPITPAGDTTDERLRLLYVAMTRAKSELIMSSHLLDENSKESLPLSYIAELPTTVHDQSLSVSEATSLAEIQWQQSIINLPLSDMKSLLEPVLKNYSISATHLTAFLDITRGGPQEFLLNCLLHFPTAPTPQSAFGTAIHKTLQTAHAHLSATGNLKPIEDVLKDFEDFLSDQRLPENEYEFYLKKGGDALQIFLSERYGSFKPNQIAERSFNSGRVQLGNMRLTGNIDLLDIDKDKNVIITDYKTGKAIANWRGDSAPQKIKLHKFKYQLMFYRLLIENSPDYGANFKPQTGTIEFVEHLPNKAIQTLEFDYSEADMERFVRLLNAVWKCIQSLDFPDTSIYPPTLKGIQDFEEFLLTSTS